MNEKDKNRLPQDKDRHLDVPQEANRDKHINFLDIEDTGDQNRNKKDEETEARQKQWKEGLEEGKRARGERGNNI